MYQLVDSLGEDDGYEIGSYNGRSGGNVSSNIEV